MHIYLKIKAKELAAEAKYNKQEQRKCKKAARKNFAAGRDRIGKFKMSQFWGMKDHLDNVVKKHIRCTHIARAFLSGREYSDVERWTYRPLTAMDWDYIWEMIFKYGDNDNPKYNQDIEDRYDAWYDRAQDWIQVWQHLDYPDRQEVIRQHCPLRPKKVFDKSTIA